jgi:hypothetical protein
VTEQQIKAHLVKQIGCKKGSDGKVGLIRFVRQNPAKDGSTEIWMALPNDLLPGLAIAAVRAMPQPKGGMGPQSIPFALQADEVLFGGNADGENVITFKVGEDAAISFKLDDGQVQALAASMAQHSGIGSIEIPPGTRH